MESILEQCSIRELLLFDVTKPMANYSTIILVAVSAVLLNNIIYTVYMRNATHTYMNTLVEEQGREFDVYKDKKISPLVLGVSEFINSGIYAPMVEELFFRFLFLKIVLIKIFKFDFHTANFFHAVIFGALHMTNAVVSDQEINRTIIQSVMAGFGGLIAGYTYAYTNTILTPLLSHFINNMMSAGSEFIDYAQHYKTIVEKFKIVVDKCTSALGCTR
jgi:membrane protease YdiL (CAAX protease family)